MPSPPSNVGDAPLDPSDCPDGTRRLLLFRKWTKKGPLNRSVGPLVGIFYHGPLVEEAGQLREHIVRMHGLGDFKVVVQEAIRQRFLHVDERWVSTKPAPLPPVIDLGG